MELNKKELLRLGHLLKLFYNKYHNKDLLCNIENLIETIDNSYSKEEVKDFDELKKNIKKDETYFYVPEKNYKLNKETKDFLKLNLNIVCNYIKETELPDEKIDIINEDINYEQILELYFEYLNSFKDKKRLNKAIYFMKYNNHYLCFNTNEIINDYDGVTYPITNNKYYIIIRYREENNVVNDIVCYVHEMEHVLSDIKEKRSYPDDISEARSFISELYFLDFLIEKTGSVNIIAEKISYLINFLNYLCEDVYDEHYYGTIEALDCYYKYKNKDLSFKMLDRYISSKKSSYNINDVKVNNIIINALKEINEKIKIVNPSKNIPIVRKITKKHIK